MGENIAKVVYDVLKDFDLEKRVCLLFNVLHLLFYFNILLDICYHLRQCI